MGRLAVQSALARDVPPVMGLALVASVLAVLTHLLVDVADTLLDPRVESVEGQEWAQRSSGGCPWPSTPDHPLQREPSRGHTVRSERT
jgi:hypothetical protein